MEYKSLCDVFHARGCVDNSGITFIYGENDEEFVSYRELYSKALTALSNLQERGIKKGQELVMQIDDNKTFVVVFWACLLGGIIPVPVTVGNNDEHKLKIFNIWDVLNCPYLITNSKTFLSLEKYAFAEEMNDSIRGIKEKTVLLDQLNLDISNDNAQIHEAGPQDTAFIQFSSGSTGEPKGVVLTHENLITNIEAIVKGGQYVPGEKSLSWMPLTHDMGLIGFHIIPLAVGAHQYLMPASLFIRRPALWMKKVNDHKVAITSSPNFGYKYFMDLFKPDVARDWDLSNVRIIFNGAEPISYNLCTKFQKLMSCYGLKESVMFNVYGLAEACLAVSFPPVGEGIVYIDINRKNLSIGNAVSNRESNRESNNTDGSIRFIDLGYVVEYCSIRVCDEDNNELDENVVGHIQIKGENVTKGYYNNKEATEKAFTPDGWLITGDLGVIRDRRLVVTGRAKDIIFINGQNYYPHDIERVAEDIEEISLGEVAVCGVPGSKEYTESACLFVLFKKELKDFIPLAARLKEHIVKKTGIEIKEIIPIKKMPKTTSGKIQRYKLAQKYENNEYIKVLEELKCLIDEFKVRVREEQNKCQIRESDGRYEVTGELMKVENEVVEIFQDVLGYKEIDVYESFFSLGVNSILLSQIYFKLQDHFSINIALTDLFSYHNIRKLSKFISNGHKAQKIEKKKSCDIEIEEIIDQMAQGQISADKFAESLAMLKI